MALNREQLDALRTVDVPLVFTPRCHPDSGTMTAYVGDGLMQVDCSDCGNVVVEFEVVSDLDQQWPGEYTAPVVDKGSVFVCRYCGRALLETPGASHGSGACVTLQYTCPECGLRWFDGRATCGHTIEPGEMERACPSCGWAMSDHGDPPMCPPVPGEQGEGGSRR